MDAVRCREPEAAARRSRRTGVIAGVVGVVAGLVTSIELDIQPGPCVVLVLSAMFALASAWAWAGRRDQASSPRAGTPSPSTLAP